MPLLADDISGPAVLDFFSDLTICFCLKRHRLDGCLAQGTGGRSASAVIVCLCAPAIYHSIHSHAVCFCFPPDFRALPVSVSKGFHLDL